MRVKRRVLSIILMLAMVVGLLPGMSLKAFADEPDNTNYDLDATATSDSLAERPGVYTVKATVNSTGDNPKTAETIGIPSVAKQNLAKQATKELPAIIMGAAVNYELRTGPTEFTLISGKTLVAPYSYFRWGVMEEQTKETDGSITVHKKLSGALEEAERDREGITGLIGNSLPAYRMTQDEMGRFMKNYILSGLERRSDATS